MKFERIEDNSYKYTKELFFFVCNFYDPIGAYDQCVIASKEAFIEVHYESLDTYHEIYEHYLIV